MSLYSIKPQDVFFFRDGRPMETGQGTGGHGANWPMPSVIFDALHAALHRAFGQKLGTGFHFGSLSTAGPFPQIQSNDHEEWLFPSPHDLVMVEHGEPCEGQLIPTPRDASGNIASDLPELLSYVLRSPAKPSKLQPDAWRTKHAIESYLRGEDAPSGSTYSTSDIFLSEWTTGIRIDPETETQDGEHIYSAEYLRLRDETAFGVHAFMPRDRKGRDPLDCDLETLFPESGQIVVMGGQQRSCKVHPLQARDLTTVLPLSQFQPINEFVKWVLVSPAIFPRVASAENGEHPGGWLPNWVSTDGKVLLRSFQDQGGFYTNRQDRRTRRKSRHLNSKPIDARLVAVRLKGSEPVTGYSARAHLPSTAAGPRPLHHAVPAGTVYYFQAESPGAAQELATALSWHANQTANLDHVLNRRSGYLAEKGFGLGVCGNWTPQSSTNL